MIMCSISEYSITKNKYISLVFVLFFFFSSLIHAQNRRSSLYDSYILKYSPMAVQYMNNYKIPASIILAQGLLESGAGTSYLAKEGNNHFGIKCYNKWKGPALYKDDDLKNECFKKYKDVSDSFDDHSAFLQRPHYKFLYSLSLTDYKGWAHGLKKAGYATDKNYAPKLIKLIEDYELYRFDDGSYASMNQNVIVNSSNKKIDPVVSSKPSFNVVKHKVEKNNGVKYIIVRNGDSFYSVAEEFDLKVSDLFKYNELPSNATLVVGQLLYVQNKKSKASKAFHEHIVDSGESIHAIAQRYGMKTESIFKLNKLPYGSPIAVGDILKLR